MRLQARIPVSIVAVAALALLAQAGVSHAQTPAGQSSSSQSSSSQSSADQVATPQGAPDQTPVGGRYISIDPLALVRYDNRFDVSLGMAYDHMKAGPNLLQGSNLGGLDLSGSIGSASTGPWRHRAAATWAPAAPRPNAPYNIKGPFVQEYFFTAGPEWLGPHNKHGAIMAHVLVGGVDGMFEKDLLGQSPSVVGFYNNQLALAASWAATLT